MKANQMDDSNGPTTSDGFPASDGGALFGKMMLAIRTSHSFGNRVRMIKLPLILTDAQLYGGAIANFYWLTRALERALEAPAAKEHPILDNVRGLQMQITGAYESDLKQLFGEKEWEDCAMRARTPATDAYVAVIESADPVRLVAGCQIAL
jgi:heme oxygenase